MRWPFMCKSTHDNITAAYDARLDSAIQAITAERERATKEGIAKVHRFMVEANAAVFQHPRPDVAIRAVFQQAEREFRPTPLTFAEHLYGPANLEEALNAQSATAT